MTTVPQIPLAKRVERRIRSAYCEAPRWTRKDEAWRSAAQAAVEACQVERLADALREVRPVIASRVKLSPMPGGGRMPLHPELLAKIDALLAEVGERP